MNKTVRIGLMVVGIFVAIFIAAAIILVATVDPNEYKEEIAQAVKDETGRELHFEGDISFNFFPWLGLEVGPMALGNAKGFSPDEMVRISRAEASIQIMPLLAGEVSIGVVVLDGFNLNLSRNASGVTNWDDLGKPEKEKAERIPSEKKGKDDEQRKLEALSVQGIEITNANMIYNDMQTGKKTSLTKLNLEIGEVNDKAPFTFKLAFDLKLDDPKIDTRPEMIGIARFDLEAGSFEISELVLDALGMKITGLFFAKSKGDVLDFSGEMTLSETSPRKLMAQLGIKEPVTADPKVLEKMSAVVKFYGTADSASLESLTFKLDDTTLQGTGTVQNFAKPAIVLSMNVDQIDVDRYLPPPSEPSGAETKTAPAREDSKPAEEPDLSALKDVDLTGKLTVGKTKAMNLIITEILLETRAKNGILTANPFSAQLYDGTLSGKGVLDANPKPATWKESASLNGVQAGPLLKDLTGKDRLLGTTVVKYDLHGKGLTLENIKKSISGKASFAFTEGAINGVNVAKMLRDTFNKIKGKPAGQEEPAKTDFAELLGSAVLENGHITNNDLLMKSPLLRISGKGWADLPENSLDYTAMVTVVGTLKGQEGASMEELSGLPLPIYAKGSLDSPDIGLDAKAMAEALLKDTFKQGTKQIEEKLRKDILGGGADDSGKKDSKPDPGSLMKGIFKK